MPTLAIISSLTEISKTASRIEKMKIISLIYDIVFADKKFRESAECSPLIPEMRKNAKMNLEDIGTEDFLALLVRDNLIHEKKHFRCS